MRQEGGRERREGGAGIQLPGSDDGRRGGGVHAEATSHGLRLTSASPPAQGRERGGREGGPGPCLPEGGGHRSPSSAPKPAPPWPTSAAPGPLERRGEEEKRAVVEEEQREEGTRARDWHRRVHGGRPAQVWQREAGVELEGDGGGAGPVKRGEAEEGRPARAHEGGRRRQGRRREREAGWKMRENTDARGPPVRGTEWTFSAAINCHFPKN